MVVEAVALWLACTGLWCAFPGDDGHYVDDACDWVTYRVYCWRWDRTWKKRLRAQNSS